MTFWRGITAAILALSISTHVYAAPVYNPSTKSYFELVGHFHFVKGNIAASEGPTWAEAFRLARQREYKGVHGRLAIVKTFATHNFLEMTFHPKFDTWIGLRYWCATHKLQWSDGEILTHLSFAAWAPNWRQSPYVCNTMTQYAPIAYSPVQEGFRWIAKGWSKRFYTYFVEYPTGHR